MNNEIQEYLNSNIANIERFEFYLGQINVYMEDGTVVLLDACGNDGEIDVIKIG